MGHTNKIEHETYYTSRYRRSKKIYKLGFRLNQFPFILEGTLKHFENYLNKYHKIIEKIQNYIYVDDLVSGETNTDEAENLKQKPIELFSKGGFNLHKWHSKLLSLESTSKNSGATSAK